LDQQTDLTVMLGGVSVDLTRVYDSLGQNQVGTFGAGWRLATVDSQVQVDVAQTGREAFGVYNPFRVGTRLYLTTPTGERVGFTFAPVREQIQGLVYYRPGWVADAGVDYRLTSADAQLTMGGNRLYDLTTARPYNPASGWYEGAEFTLTAANGTRYEISGKDGVKTQVNPNGTRLFFSDSGIVSSTGESVRFVRDAAGRIERITAPDGTQVVYSYENGNLVAERNLAIGQSSRYGYTGSNAHELTIVSSRPGAAGSLISYGAVPRVEGIRSDLGGVVQFSQAPTTGSFAGAGAIERYTFSLRNAEIQTTDTDTVLLGVEVTAQAAVSLNLVGAQRLLNRFENGKTFGLFVVGRSGLNLLELTGAGAGSYGLKLSVVGDVNADSIVDGQDSALVVGALQSGNGAYDLNRDGVVSAADVQLLAGNYGFVANRGPVVTAKSVLTHVDSWFAEKSKRI
jgi:large repetitive protein